MEQYIKKSALLSEIERRLSEYENCGIDNTTINAKIIALQGLLIYINTLKTKEVDLENEIDLIEDKYHGFESLSRADIIEIIKHFFELGLFSQLTWQDIRLISEIGEDFMNSEESDNLGEEEYYTMILNKLKEKGRDYKTERQITRELEQKGEEV